MEFVFFSTIINLCFYSKRFTHPHPPHHPVRLTMGGCASRPKDLNAENPDLVPAERPITSEPTVNPVEPEPKPEPETTESPVEAKEEAEVENEKEKEVNGEELVVESNNKAEGEEDLVNLKETEVQTDNVQEPTSTTTTTDVVVASEEEEVKPESKSTEENKPEEQN